LTVFPQEIRGNTFGKLKRGLKGNSRFLAEGGGGGKGKKKEGRPATVRPNSRSYSGGGGGGLFGRYYSLSPGGEGRGSLPSPKKRGKGKKTVISVPGKERMRAPRHDPACREPSRGRVGNLVLGRASGLRRSTKRLVLVGLWEGSQNWPSPTCPEKGH